MTQVSLLDLQVAHPYIHSAQHIVLLSIECFMFLHADSELEELALHTVYGACSGSTAHCAYYSTSVSFVKTQISSFHWCCQLLWLLASCTHGSFSIASSFTLYSREQMNFSLLILIARRSSGELPKIAGRRATEE